MNIGIDMVQFSVFTVILAVIAAVIDLTITISSPMYELNETNPTLSRKALFQSGMRVVEILATSANTIYLAYFGGQLTLFFWFSNYIILSDISSTQNICPRIYFNLTRWNCRSD